MPSRFAVHLALITHRDGTCSALCGVPSAYWTHETGAVTCPKCLDAMQLAPA